MAVREQYYGKPKHPWDVWFKRKSIVLTKGKDFQGMPHAMSVQLRTAARKRGFKVSIQIKGKTLTVTRSKEA